MTEIRVVDIAYPGLAHVFAPPGLRLVEKSAGAAPTTSVLVRGAAGTGKTTLGLAVAQALAKASGGIVVYVATETSLADAIDKASVLKLGSPPVAYDTEAVLPEGAVALAHLVVARDDAQDAPPSRLAKLVIDYAYELASSRKADAPLRAVVMDSFELPETSAPELERSDLAAFVQGMESLGVSPVFVEEVGAGTSERLTFVVDVVFQLALAAEPPSTALHRKISVLKSRYSQAIPGPHDMALDAEVPTVWPDSPSLDFGGLRTPVGFVVPQAGPGRELLTINRGTLVLSRYDADVQRVLRCLLATPGVSSATVNCGPLIQIADAEAKSWHDVPAELGPSALAWALHRVLGSRKANAVTFLRLEHLLAQPRFATALPGLLASLTRRGFLVCVHGTNEGLKPIDKIADYTGPTGHFNYNDAKAPIVRSYRAATAWAKDLPGLPAPVPMNIPEHDKLTAAIKAAKERLTADDVVGAHHALSPDSGAAEPAILWRRIEMVLLLDRMGQSSVAQRRLDAVKNQIAGDAGVRAAIAWAYAEIGAEWDALWLAFEGIDQVEPPDAVRRLWHSAFLRYSSVTTHMEFADWAGPIQARFVAQALASRGNIAFADKVLDLAANRQGLSGPHVARLRADVRLESSDRAAWQEASDIYAISEAAGGLGLLDRADVLFNRGVIAERLGDVASAIERYRAAKAENPLLEAADERLAALDAL
jgi:KaiC/GvpD/RAD55 family RecA-like ATPase